FVKENLMSTTSGSYLLPAVGLAPSRALHCAEKAQSPTAKWRSSSAGSESASSGRAQDGCLTLILIMTATEPEAGRASSVPTASGSPAVSGTGTSKISGCPVLGELHHAEGWPMSCSFGEGSKRTGTVDGGLEPVTVRTSSVPSE